MSSLHRTSLLCLLSFVSTSSQAQEFASVTGIAVDSVRGGVLRDALISIVGSSRTVVSDSSGRFRIDSIPIGSHALRMSHPLLDTLGVAVTSRAYAFRAMSDVPFVLAVPSPATIVATRCSAADRARGGGALAGVVVDADTEMPIAGAEVRVSWTDYQIGSKEFAKTAQTRSAAARADGTYLICGIPIDLTTGVVARRESDSTAAVPVNFASIVAIQNFFLPGSQHAIGVNPAPRAILTGSVTDAKGKLIEGARIAVEGDSAVAVSSSTGTFSIANLRAGTRAVSVRKIGYQPEEFTVALTAREPRRVAIQLKTPISVLEAVRVTALRDIGLQRVGFTDRKKFGMGSYITPQMIAARGAPRLNYLLEHAMYLRTHTAPDGKRYIVPPPNNCLRYYVDGYPWSPMGGMTESPDQYLSGAEIAAVEIYGKLFAPPEFSLGNCLAVVIWTKWKLKM